MRGVTCTLVVCAIACLALTQRAGAQQTADADAHPVFGAADIHPSARGAAIRLPFINSEMRGGFVRSGRYELHNATMADLIGTAWGVDTYKVIGGPAWLDTDQFDVVARAPANASPESLRLMLQALLVERFKLVVHQDTKPFRAYVLTAGNHPQLKQAAGSGESGCQSPPQNSQDAAPGAIPATTVSCRNMTMADFTSRLARMARCCQATAVTDLTGLNGAWDFTIRFTDRSLLAAAGAEGVSIYDAVEKQLGLKLEVQNVPMPVVIVDSVNEKPTDNLPGVAKSLPPIPTKFEVADIKPSAPESTQRSFRLAPGGRVDARGFTLKELIKFAWELQDMDVIDNDDMLVGAPKGLESARFDIVAEVYGDGAHTAPGFDLDSARLMLRALLADRFKLATHNEDRPVSVYAMVAAKPKLKKAEPANRTGCRNAPAPSGFAPIFSLHCQNTTMAQLAEELPAFGGLYITHPVVDATGLEGGWDFDLTWSPPHLIRGGEAGPPASDAAVVADPNGALSIVEALDKQLGLKLELRKHPMPVVVIDHVELKPTDN